MSRMIPRIMAAIVVLCTVCMPPSTYAEPLSGPDRDPHIETYTQLSLTCPLPIFVDCDFDGIYNTFADFEEAGGGAHRVLQYDIFLFSRCHRDGH